MSPQALCLTRAWVLLAAWTVFLNGAVGRAVNMTIDDKTNAAGSATIDYTDGWKDGSSCTDCTARPDSNQIYEGSWHDTTYNPDNPSTHPISNASVIFNGTAIYVFCVLARTSTSPTGDSDMSFFINDSFVDHFVQPAPGLSGFEYNVSVYSNASLPPGLHRFTLQNGNVAGTKALTMLDYILYTTEEDGNDETGSVTFAGSATSQASTTNGDPIQVTSLPSTSTTSTSATVTQSTSNSNLTTVIPAVVVPIIVLANLIVCVVLYRRRRYLREL